MQLGKGSDVGPQLGRLPRWEVFAQEGFRECVPGSKSIGLLILEPISGSIPQREREEPQADGVGGDPIEFNGITLRKEITKVHVGVLKRVPTKLVSLHQRD